MSQLAEDYLNSVIALLERVRDEEMPAIDEAAELMAEAVASGKQLFAFGCTHSALPVQDIVYRAGGLMLVNPILAPGIDSLDVHPATMSSDMEKMPGYAKVILDNTPIKAGDILIVVSVSGRNAVPIEIAQLARERGITVIGVTSHAYTAAVEARHASGKKMYEFAHIVLDNKVPPGDAILQHEDVPQKFAPASGVTSNALLHALVAATVSNLLERGITPPIFLAANIDGGKEWNARLLAENRDRIHFI